jgi:isopenicillin N synthase-like dioxygenase
MNIFKAMAVKDLEEASRAIPVIDVAPAFPGAAGELDAVAAQVRRASEQVGFFYVAGHGVPAELIDAAFQASREFHALPL